MVPPLGPLLRHILKDPIEGGRLLIALNPPMAARWMLLAMAVLGSVLLLFLLPVMMGEAGLLPAPWFLTLTQGALNVVVALLITHVGRAFGGTGGFADALWLVGWLQVVTLALLAVQVLSVMLLPAANVIVAVASVAVTIWVLVGFVCAVHGFRSREKVLVGSLLVFVVFSFVIALVLLMLGVTPPEAPNV